MTRAVAASLACACFLAACGDKTTEPSQDTGRVALDVVVGPGPSVVLDSGRVHLDGPTPRVLSATPGSQVTIDDLLPGSYTITLEGFAGNDVERFGRTTGVQVTVGDTTSATVTLDLFQPVLAPVTLSADGLSLQVTFPAVPASDSYQVEVDSTAAFATATVQTLTGTSATFPVLLFGAHFIRARAFDPYDVPGTRTSPKAVTVLALPSVATLDGFGQNDGNAGAGATNPVVGDLEGFTPGVASREFFSFDLSLLSPAAVVTGAVMRLYQAGVVGDPYASLGDLIVDHLDYGPALDGGDYNLPALAENIGTLSNNATAEFKPLPVTTNVQADRTAGRGFSQFRIRFAIGDIDNDAASDYAMIRDADIVCCNPEHVPQLVVVSE